MRILLTSNASYDPPKGGSTYGNLAWLRHLASAGHEVRVVSAGDSDGESLVSGIAVRSVKNLSFRASVLNEEIRSFGPDHMLVSSEDLSHILLKHAAQEAPDRLVYLAHTPQWFPFGPVSWNSDPEAAALLRRARAVVTIGPHMASYVQQHLGGEVHTIHPPIYGQPPWPDLSRFGSGSVLMINPCAAKGISIFLALAARFPNVEFAGLAGWGTTSADRAAMNALPNVTILERVPRIEDALAQATLLLMPSLWYEGFGLIAMEALLRGLPVVASDSGGLADAKRGTGYVIPVNPITNWRREFDETHMPVAEVPEQNIAPWAEALALLLGDETVYKQESARSRQQASRFVSSLDVGSFLRMLEALPAPRTASTTAADSLKRLSPKQIELLRRKLMERKSGS